jgi:hypothetical protein
MQVPFLKTVFFKGKTYEQESREGKGKLLAPWDIGGRIDASHVMENRAISNRK